MWYINITNFSVSTCKQGDWIILPKVLSCSDILFFFSIITWYDLLITLRNVRAIKKDVMPLLCYCSIFKKNNFHVQMSFAFSGHAALLPPHLKLRQNFQVQITVLILDIPNGPLNCLPFFLDICRGYFLSFPGTFQRALRRGGEDIVELHGTVYKHLRFNVYRWMKKTMLKL